MAGRKILRTGLMVCLAATIPVGSASLSRAADPQNTQISFKNDVLPIFQKNCATCHDQGGLGYQASGMLLVTYQGVMNGTRFGPMIVPYLPDESNLVRMIDWNVDPKIRMPHEGKRLSLTDRNTIRFWIKQGAGDN